MNTTVDNSTYYTRHPGEDKLDLIRRYVLSLTPAVKSVFDVGCNTGKVSAQFLTRGCRVGGIDLAADVKPPPGYDYRQGNVITDNKVDVVDCTLFLSLYHHLLGAYGLEAADRIFYQSLLRSRTLVFDTGNTSEVDRRNCGWYTSQAAKFDTELKLLDHFNLPYTILGTYKVAGGVRTIVAFDRAQFDLKVTVVDEYIRKCGSRKQPEGLFSVKDNPKLRSMPSTVYHFGTTFYKLRLGDRLFFAKKHTLPAHNIKEFKNVVNAYSVLTFDQCVRFYGLSDIYGLVYEWLPEFKYIGKCNKCIGGIHLRDSDYIEVKGVRKLIDFFALDGWR